jgi:hypothetical protein
MKLNTLVLWSFVGVGLVFMLQGSVLAGIVILAALFLNQAIYSTSSTNKVSDSVQNDRSHEPQASGKPELEPEFYLNLTHAHLEKESGWDRWTIYPNQSRVKNDHCFGGPPTYEDIYEYEIRRTAVRVRMLESSKEDFDQKTYEVFNGRLVRTQIESKCLDINLSLKDEVKRLQSETEWHDSPSLIRYFVLANTEGSRDFLSSEHSRLEQAFKSVAREAAQLGAVWGEYNYYVAPDAATDGQKEAINKFQSDERLLRFGITFSELCSQKEILSILNTKSA